MDAPAAPNAAPAQGALPPAAAPANDPASKMWILIALSEALAEAGVPDDADTITFSGLATDTITVSAKGAGEPVAAQIPAEEVMRRAEVMRSEHEDGIAEADAQDSSQDASTPGDGA